MRLRHVPLAATGLPQWSRYSRPALRQVRLAYRTSLGSPSDGWNPNRIFLEKWAGAVLSVDKDLSRITLDFHTCELKTLLTSSRDPAIGGEAMVRVSWLRVVEAYLVAFAAVAYPSVTLADEAARSAPTPKTAVSQGGAQLPGSVAKTANASSPRGQTPASSG